MSECQGAVLDICHKSDRMKGVQSTEAQRIAGDREFPVALFPPSHINTLYVRALNFSLSLLEKDTSKAWMWYEMETLIVQIQHGDFLLFIMVFPSAVIIKAVTPWVRKSEISVWSYFTSGSEVDRTSKSGWCFNKYFLGTSMWAQESAFRLYKKKDPSKNFIIHQF